MSDIHDQRPAPIAASPLPVSPRAAGRSSPLDRAPDAERLTPLAAWRAIRLWWKAAAAVGIVCAAAAGAVVCWMFVPTYESLAIVEVREHPIQLLPGSSDSRGGQGYVLSQAEFMRSPVVLNRVLTRAEIAQLPELEKEPIPLDWIRKVLTIKVAPNSELVEIRCTSRIANTTAAISNAVANTYLEMQVSDFDQRRGEIVKLLEKNKTERTAEVVRLRERVKTLSANVKDFDPTGAAKQFKLENSLLSTLIGELSKLEVDRTVLEATMTAIQRPDAQTDADVSPEQMDRLLQESPDVRRFTAAIETKKEKLRLLQEKAAVNYQADVNKLKAEITKNEQDLETAKKELRERYQAELKRLNQEKRSAETKDLQNEVAGMQIREQVIRDRIKAEQEKQAREQTDQGNHGLTWAFAKQELDGAESMLQQINKRIDIIRTEAGAPGRVELRMPATVPTAPKETTPYKRLIPVCLVGFLLPFGLAVLWERVVRRVGDSHQLTQTSRLRILGEVASFPVRRLTDGRDESERLIRARSVYEESIDCLKTALTLSEDLQHVRTIAVASAVSKEGKTSLASQLALSLARSSGERVLLIDGDLRSPDIHDIFELSRDPGLCGVLSRRHGLDEAIVTSWSDQLHLLPAGTLTVSPNVLLTTGDFTTILKSLRDTYRYILIDTPPVLSTSEALILAKSADGVVLSAMREVSRSVQVRMAYDRLMSAGANLIGLVLNGVPTSHYSYKYGAYVYQQD